MNQAWLAKAQLTITCGLATKRTFEHNEKFNEKNFIDKLHYCQLTHLRIFIAAVFNIIDGFRLRNLIFSHPPKGIKTGFE